MRQASVKLAEIPRGSYLIQCPSLEVITFRNPTRFQDSRPSEARTIRASAPGDTQFASVHKMLLASRSSRLKPLAGAAACSRRIHHGRCCCLSLRNLLIWPLRRFCGSSVWPAALQPSCKSSWELQTSASMGFPRTIRAPKKPSGAERCHP